MDEAVGPACQLMAPQLGAALGVLSASLALLVLAAIGLGFGPLRDWLDHAAGRLPRRTRSADSPETLLGAWRLYHDLERGQRDGCRLSRVRDTSADRTPITVQWQRG